MLRRCHRSKLLIGFSAGILFLFFYHKGSEDVLGFCFRHFRLLELFQFRSRQPCSSNEGFLFVRLEISSAQLCSVFGKHLFIVQCSEFMFASEHCLNTPSEHFFVYKKGRGAEAPPPFWICVTCSLRVFRQCSNPNMNSEHGTLNTCFRTPNSVQGAKIRSFLPEDETILGKASELPLAIRVLVRFERQYR